MAAAADRVRLACRPLEDATVAPVADEITHHHHRGGDKWPTGMGEDFRITSELSPCQQLKTRRVYEGEGTPVPRMPVQSE